jgi:hypothetical protein
MMISRHRDRPNGRTPRNALARLVALSVIAAVPVLLGVASASAGVANDPAFLFVSPHVAGAPTGSVAITGVGSYDTSAGSLHANGLFRCTNSVAQGPLAGCMSGQGVHWSSATLNATQRFVCGTDAAKTVTTDSSTAAFKADFFRLGDTGSPSFSANVIVSAHDIAPDVQGVQNTWIQGVGCGSALQFFAN